MLETCHVVTAGREDVQHQVSVAAIFRDVQRHDQILRCADVLALYMQSLHAHSTVCPTEDDGLIHNLSVNRTGLVPQDQQFSWFWGKHHGLQLVHCLWTGISGGILS